MNVHETRTFFMLKLHYDTVNVICFLFGLSLQAPPMLTCLTRAVLNGPASLLQHLVEMIAINKCLPHKLTTSQHPMVNFWIIK